MDNTGKTAKEKKIEQNALLLKLATDFNKRHINEDF